MGWVNENEVDLGFVDTDVIHVPDGQVVYHDEMLAVLPCEHTLAQKQSVSIEELLEENFILADQGEDNNIFHAFPNVIQPEKISALNISFGQVQLSVSNDHSLRDS